MDFFEENIKKEIILEPIIDVDLEDFKNLLRAVIIQAIEDFLYLNPYLNKSNSELNANEAIEYRSAEEFLFNDIEALGDLVWTFSDVCKFLGLDSEILKRKIIKLDRKEFDEPKNYQLELF